MTALVAATGVSFVIDDARLIEDVSLAVDAGELIAVVGPNGAGKSTLLRLLAGDLVPSSGTVSILGDPVASLPLGDLALRRAYLGEQPPAAVPFTARQVVAMGRHPHLARAENTPAEDDRAVDEALAATDTADLGDRVFATLSGGEAQRIGVARILAQHTPIALLDEPTAALDIGHQAIVVGCLRRIATAGGAVVAVIHDLNLATAADRVLLLNDGTVAAEGTPRQVFGEALLSAIYRHPVRVTEHPFRDAPLVLPVDAPSR